MQLHLDPPQNGVDYVQGETIRGLWIVDTSKDTITMSARVNLDYITRGNDVYTVQCATHKVDPHTLESGINEIAFELEVPPNAPVSWEDSYLKVEWQINASPDVLVEEEEQPSVVQSIQIVRGQGPIDKTLLEKHAKYTPPFDRSLASKAKTSFVYTCVSSLFLIAGGIIIALSVIYLNEDIVYMVGFSLFGGGLVAMGVYFIWLIILQSMADMIFDENTLTCTPVICRGGEPFSFRLACESRLDIEITYINAYLVGEVESRYWGETIDSNGLTRKKLITHTDVVVDEMLEWTGDLPLHVGRGETLVSDLSGRLDASIPSTCLSGDYENKLYNQITWKLRIHMNIPRWPDVNWYIPVYVL